MNLTKLLILLTFINLSWAANAGFLREANITKMWKVIDINKPTIKVGILDTGIDVNYPYVWNLLPYKLKPLNCFGWDAVDFDCIPSTRDLHGTWVAQVLVRTYPRARAVPIKVLDMQRHIYLNSTIDSAVAFIKKNPQMKVISMSISSQAGSYNLWQGVEDLKNAKVLFVVSSGNSNVNIDFNDSYPSSFKQDNLLVVGASYIYEGKVAKKSFSNYGRKNVDLFTSDTVFVSNDFNSGKSVSGTSFAAPKVAAVAAMLFNEFPHLNYKQVKKIIMDSVRKYKRLKRFCVSSGTLDAYAAYKLAKKRYRKRKKK